MKGKTALMAGVAAIALVASVGAADAKQKHHADEATDNSPPMADSASASKGPSNAELAARLQAVEDALEADEAKEQSDHNRLSALDQDFHDTTWSFDNARPTIKSGDGRFSMAIRVRFQGDFAGFMQDKPPRPGTVTLKADDLSSGAVFRRAYLGVEGRAFRDFWYELRFNAGGSDGGSLSGGVGEGDPVLNKAVITYTGIPNFHINAGVIEPNFMFEGTTSSAWLTFMERPEIDNIAADAFGAGDSRRGIEMNWQKTDTLWAGDNLNMTVAYTGAKTGSNAGHGNGGDEQAQVLGRISDRLWTDGISNVQIGASGSDVVYSGGKSGGPAIGIQLRDRPEIRVDGTRLIDTGNFGSAKHGYMYAFDAGANIENFFVGGEYSHFQVDESHLLHPHFGGWYVEGSWFITGETRQYSPSALNNEVGGWQGPSAVASPFSLDGDSWGAWELAARYSDTDLNWHLFTPTGVAGGRESVVDIALNWYLNRNIRLMMDDLIIHVNRFTTATSGIQGGQDLNVVGVRLQFAN